jgi:hypothetical protein
MRIVIVCGAQRSGTTLTQTLIANALPNAPLLPEAHIPHDLLRSWKRAKDQWAKTSRIYQTEQDALHYFQGAMSTHLNDIAARHADAEYLILKDPNFIDVLPEIAEIIPSAKTLICIRDPRDIVASFLKIGQRDAERKQKTRYSRREIRFICDKIKSSYQPVIDSDVPAGASLVRYEDIVTDAAETLRRIARDTGLPLDPGRLNSLKWLEDEYRHQETWRTELEGGPPTARSVGSFRQSLSLYERAQVQMSCHTLIRKLRYTNDAEDKSARTLHDRIRRWVRRRRGRVDR